MELKHACILLFLVMSVVSTAQEFCGIKQINGAGIFCRVTGKGEPLIIVHGGPGLGHDYMLKYYMQLAKKYRLIFFDQRGNGLSDEFKKDEKITVDDLVEDIEGVRKEFGAKKVFLAGSSWGSILATKYTLKYPENIMKLLLLEPAPASTSYLPAFIQNIKKNMTEQDREEKKALENNPNIYTDTELYRKIILLSFKAYYYSPKNFNPHEYDYMDSLRIKKDIASSAMFNPYLGNFNLYDSMKNISCPVLIIHGENDVIPTESILQMKESMKQAEIHILKECGHFAFIEQGKQYFKLINKFLSQK